MGWPSPKKRDFWPWHIYLLVVCWPSSWFLYKQMGSWGRKNFIAFPANERIFLLAHLQRCLGAIFGCRLFCWKDSKNITSHGISDSHRIHDWRAGVGAGNVWRLKKGGDVSDQKMLQGGTPWISRWFKEFHLGKIKTLQKYLNMLRSVYCPWFLQWVVGSSSHDTWIEVIQNLQYLTCMYTSWKSPVNVLKQKMNMGT